MDMDTVSEILAPLILAIISALIGILVYAVNLGKAAFIEWMKSKAGANNQAIIDRLAHEAHAYAERWAEAYGAAKMDMAINYLTKEAAARGIVLSGEKVKATIQAAWMEHNAAKEKAKPVTVNTTITTPADNTVEVAAQVAKTVMESINNQPGK